MNGITTETTKILTEKLSLVRELATLKPELEHLRSQASYQHTVLAEKLALQRQVSTLEVELKTEKRASKRAAQKSRNSDAEIELQNQLDQLQKDLAREKREREKARKEVELEHQCQVEELQRELAQEKRAREKNRKETETDVQDRLEELQRDLARERRDGEKACKEAEKELKSAETRISVLESKLDQLRMKLRATKDQLKECQTELSQARAVVVKAGPAASKGDAAVKNPRKRGALEMSTDVEIGTPDGVAMRGKRPVAKRGRMDQMMVGEKSMFSITPFLNRTISMPPQTPGEEMEPEALEKEQRKVTGEPTAEVVREQPPTSRADPAPAAVPKPRKKKVVENAPVTESKVLGEAKASNKNKKAPAKKPRVLSTLEKVGEEEGDENEMKEFVPAAAKGSGVPMVFKAGQVQLKNVDAEESGPKKKKRKLLGGGRTLFDEEDGEATKRPAKVSLGPPRLLGKGGLAGPKGGLKGGLDTVSGFGGFSPLKKDRRGVGASFLV
jgi:hypothetical protein